MIGPRITISAGEPSGDEHAAVLVRRLRERLPGADVGGLAGPRCREAGARLDFDCRDTAIVGFTGVVAAARRLRRLERALRDRIAASDLFVAVDYPGMNLRLARHARRCGVPVLYYIAPQVWAWGAARARAMARCVDRLAAILPFEEAMFRSAGVRAEFVGHPLVVDHPLPEPVADDARDDRVALLPGSRRSEVGRLLPLMLEVAERIAASRSRMRFVVARAPALEASVYAEAVARARVPVSMEDDAVAVLARSRAALVASGTATLQAALVGTPQVVVYRVGAFNYAIARALVRIPHIALVNVILGDAVVPEFVQSRARPGAVAAELASLVDDASRRERMRGCYARLRERLGRGRGCVRVAEMAAELVGE